MAVIPQIVTSPGAVPSTGGSQVRVSPQVDIRAPADPSQAQGAAASMETQALQTTARAGQQLADYGAQFAEQYVRAKLNVNAADHQAELSKKLHEAEFESSKIADRTAATADFNGRVSKIRDDFAAQDVNPTVRAAVDANLPNQIALRRASTQNAAFGLESKAQVGSLITNIDQYNKQAVDAADPRLVVQLIGQANEAIDGRVAGGWLPADRAALMKVDFESNVYRTKIELAMAKDMRSGIALYNATASKLNAADAKAMGVMVADRSKQVEAETAVSIGMPTMGGGGDVGAVRADAEKTLGFPLTITSADRTAARNAEVGGATGSQHLGHGKALDISLAGLTDEQKLKVYNQFLNDPRVGGIGFYAGHLHVDTRGGPRATWGTPPAAVADQVSVWQSTARAAPQGDQLAQWKIAGYQYLDHLDRSNLDPEMKARMRAVAERRLNIGNAIVLEQRKSAADAGEAAGIALFTGAYKPGTFQQISDQFRAAGDNSQADVFQVLASRESQAIELGKSAPAQMPVVGTLLPGAAGRIAQQQVAEARAEVTEARALAVEHRTENRRLGAEQEKIFNDGLDANVDPRTLVANALDAISYYRAAGDIAKAKTLAQQFDGALDGRHLGQLPPAERERARLEALERATNRSGLSQNHATLLTTIERFAAKGGELWNKDPLSAAQNAGGFRIQSFDIAMDGVNLQMWATKRLSDAWTATRLQNPNATNLQTPFFTVAEMSSITQKLDHMPPQQAQLFLAKLAAAVPQEAIALIGQQMSKKDAVSDSYSAALGLYALRDNDVANRVIVGMNLWQKGGEDGKTRVEVNANLMIEIDNVLGTARVTMGADAIRQQNNAIIANYIALTANDPNRKDIKPAELKQSILEIVGRRTDHNGAPTIIPREIEPYQFRNGVAAITQADVANLRPTDSGQPITAEVVRRSGQFIPVDVGRYQVRIPDPRRAGSTVQLIDSNTGRPWVVDIKPLIARGVTGQGAPEQNQPELYRRNLPLPSPAP